MTEEKQIFPFPTHQNVSHIKKAFSVGKYAFFLALDRAFLSKKTPYFKNKPNLGGLYDYK